MRAPTARGCASALIAIGALAAALAVPRSLSDVQLAPPADSVVPDQSSCGVSTACPSPQRLGWTKLVHAHLASRIPGLPERERVRLAGAILGEAERAQLDPLFVLAVIEVESGYDPGAMSDAGAQGLMQLRPSTLKVEAERSNLAESDPDDPVLNVRAGVRYYKRLLHAFGNSDLALMAYNAGPNRIIGYLKAGGVPERFQVYPRRVRAEFRRLRRAFSVEPRGAVAAREDAPPRDAPVQ